MWGAMHVAATVAMAMLHWQAEMVTFLLVMEFNLTRVIARHAVIPTVYSCKAWVVFAVFCFRNAFSLNKQREISI
jgi:hypothetical protein